MKTPPACVECTTLITQLRTAESERDGSRAADARVRLRRHQKHDHTGLVRGWETTGW